MKCFIKVLNHILAAFIVAVSSGSGSIYYYLYDLAPSLTRQQIILVNITWPRFKVSADQKLP